MTKRMLEVESKQTLISFLIDLVLFLGDENVTDATATQTKQKINYGSDFIEERATISITFDRRINDSFASNS